MDIKKVFKSFPHAIRGISLVSKERNMRVHMIAVVVVTIAGLIFSISLVEWIAVFICFGLVMSLETINTVVEDICNKLRDDLGLSYESTRDARDIAAGAVLISAMFSVYVAIIIFLPKIIDFLVKL